MSEPGHPSPGGGLDLDSTSSLYDYFASRLPERLREIDVAWESARGAGWDAATSRNLHRLAHSLAGAGATFGFPEVSEAARVLEAHLKPWVQGTAPAPEDAAVATLVDSLHRAGRPAEPVR